MNLKEKENDSKPQDNLTCQDLALNVEISSKKDFYNNNNIYYNNAKNKSRDCFIAKIVLAIIYFTLIICIEQIYREDLFDESIDAQEDIREDHDKNSAFYNFWKFISYFGEAKLTFPIFAIIFLFFPLSSSFLTLQSLIYAIYITNLFKIIYRNGRPYWESKILDVVCNSGYGNPSGHSVTSTSYYMTLPHIVTNFDFFKKKINGIILRVIIFILFWALGALVMISRIILAAHSINQVVYGFTLGLGIYYVLIYILSYHTYEPTFFIKHITSILIIIIYMILHFALLILLIIIYFSIHDNELLKEKANRDIFNGERCKIKKDYLMLRYDGFFQALALTAIIGAHLGIILLVCLLKKYKYVINGHITEFIRSSVKRWLIRLPILIVCGIFMLLHFCIPGSSPLSVIFIFKSAISFFLTTLGIFFIGIFISIHCNLANERIERIT